MSKKREKIVTAFQDGKNNRLIVSERRSGETKSEHERRIAVMQKIMSEKPSKYDRNKTDTLLEDVITAIDKWKNECIAQGENPVCISHFICVDRKTKDLSQTRYAIFGEQPEVIGLLKYTNEMLNPKGGK